MTDIGGSAPISEASVEAGNWMTALTLARKEIGETGGVPPGASCSVAPDGKVTIQDAVSRKTYVLAPDTQQSLVDATPKGPRVPAETVPRKSAPPPAATQAPKPSDRPAAAQQPVSKRTIAYDAKDLGLNVGATPGAEAAQQPVSKRTVAYDAKDLGFDVGAGSAPAQPAANDAKKAVSSRTIAYDAKDLGLSPPQQPAASPQTPKSAPAPSQAEAPKDDTANGAAKNATKAGSNRTIAYDAKDLGLSPPHATAEPEPAKKKPSFGKQTIAYDANELGIAAPEEEASEEAADRMTMPDLVPPSGPQWELLHARDEEPTAETPLTYRERVFVVPPDTSSAVLEAILQARFEEMREELSDRPKGKLVNMALFDHAWSERPSRPPLATLQWKDWRGEPIVQRGPGSQASQPPAAQPSQPAPAQASQPPADQPSQPAPAQASQPPAAQPSQPAPAQASQPPAAQPSQPAPAQASQPPAAQPSQPAPAQASQPPAAQPSQPAPAQASQPPAAQPSQPAPAQASQPAPAQASQPPAAQPSEPAEASQPPAAQPSQPPAQAVQPAPEAAPAHPDPAHAEPPPAQAAAADADEDDLGLSISDDVVESKPRLSPARTGATGDDRLANAFEALQDLFFLTTPVEGLDFVMRLLEDLIPTEATSACLYDINSDELRFVALRGPGADERKGEGVPRLSGLMGSAVLQPGAVLLFEDVGSDDRFDPGVDGRIGLEPSTMAVLAVTHQGRLMGLLQLINRVDQAQFSRSDANLLAYVGDKLGEFLQAARMRSDERQAR